MPLNKLSEQLRMETAQTGFTEVLTFALASYYTVVIASVSWLLYLFIVVLTSRCCLKTQEKNGRYSSCAHW